MGLLFKQESIIGEDEEGEIDRSMVIDSNKTKDDDVMREEHRSNRRFDAINIQGLRHRFKRHQALTATQQGVLSNATPQQGHHQPGSSLLPVSAPTTTPQSLQNGTDPTYLWAVNGISLGVPTGECF